MYGASRRRIWRTLMNLAMNFLWNNQRWIRLSAKRGNYALVELCAQQVIHELWFLVLVS